MTYDPKKNGYNRDWETDNVPDLCDICGDNAVTGQCCCGVSYCSPVCQEAHLDQVHEDDYIL
jgi:hypothetical protein